MIKKSTKKGGSKSYKMAKKGQKGTVSWFNHLRGFGFIDGADGKTYFVHHNGIQCEGYRNLMEGEKVQFDTKINTKNGKMLAVNVTGPNGADVKGKDVKPTKS